MAGRTHGPALPRMNVAGERRKEPRTLNFESPGGINRCGQVLHVVVSGACRGATRRYSRLEGLRYGGAAGRGGSPGGTFFPRTTVAVFWGLPGGNSALRLRAAAVGGEGGFRGTSPHFSAWIPRAGPGGPVSWQKDAR